ncbi:MAG: sensor histidine kinase, partial [Pseudomonadota bacterium]
GLPPGLDPASLFQPYVRGPQARGRGLGLGLSTVSRIVEAHGGRVGVESSGAGCCFWVSLPRADDEKSAHVYTSAAEAHRTCPPAEATRSD